MKSAILHSFNMNLRSAQEYVAATPAGRETELPHGLPNHPVWIIGHLATAIDMAGTLLGQPKATPESWEALFGNNSKPVADASKYPSLAELSAKYATIHVAVGKAFESASDATLATPTPEQWRKFVPTIGDALMFLMLNHEQFHLGQYSAWRRVIGLPSLH